MDGRCCNSSCGASCDFCDLTGLEGTCSTAPLGRTPSPSCPGGYACSGGSQSCVSTCNTDAGCVAARCGTGGVCIPKVSTLKEDFNSGGFDASVWVAVSANCSVVNQQFQVVTQAGPANYFQIVAARRYDLLNSDLRIELADPGNQSLATMEALANVCDYTNSNRCISLLANSNEVIIELNNMGAYSNLTGPFPMANLRRYRMREQSGTLFLDVQNDAGTYVTLGSGPTPFGSLLNDTTVSIGAGTYNAEAATSTVIWDNVNTP